MIRDCTDTDYLESDVLLREGSVDHRARPIVVSAGSQGVAKEADSAEATCPVSQPATKWRSVSLARRLAFAGIGVMFVVVGYVGMFLPGIPTVGPLIFASYFFARSCPALERVLIRNRLFAKILPYIDGEKEMPLTAKLTSIAMMWLSICCSIWLLRYSQIGGFWLPATICASGLIGTFFILRYGKQKSKH